jgi:uncharacterized protein (DUF302 family)
LGRSTFLSLDPTRILYNQSLSQGNLTDIVGQVAKVLVTAAYPIFQWIGLRENLQETMVFTIKYGVFRLNISPKPIH